MEQVKVKICGITNLDDALTAVDYGADALGFVFYKKSPRFISPSNAAAIIKELPPFVTTVGVFVDEDAAAVRKIMDEAGLTVAQLHGSETLAYCKRLSRKYIKAVRVRGLKDIKGLGKYGPITFLLDTYVKGAAGGTGRAFDWDIAVESKKFGRIILSGGLTPSNVREAVELVSPYAVDVSSGVEKEPGRKDPVKVIKFIEAAKGAPGE